MRRIGQIFQVAPGKKTVSFVCNPFNEAGALLSEIIQRRVEVLGRKPLYGSGKPILSKHSYAAFRDDGGRLTDCHSVNDKHFGHRVNIAPCFNAFSTLQHSVAYTPLRRTSSDVLSGLFTSAILPPKLLGAIALPNRPRNAALHCGPSTRVLIRCLEQENFQTFTTRTGMQKS